MNYGIISAQPTACQFAPIPSQEHLTVFVRWALRVTARGEYSGDAALSLLERAWDAQKLLWQLRDQNLPIQDETLN